MNYVSKFMWINIINKYISIERSSRIIKVQVICICTQMPINFSMEPWFRYTTYTVRTYHNVHSVKCDTHARIHAKINIGTPNKCILHKLAMCVVDVFKGSNFSARELFFSNSRDERERERERERWDIWFGCYCVYETRLRYVINIICRWYQNQAWIFKCQCLSVSTLLFI